MARKCYFCGAKATSVDHIPPKCFFPKKKHMPLGSPDYRRELITVPACKKHNESYAKDDEYIASCIVLHFDTNEVARQHVSSKIISSLKRSRGLFDAIFRHARPIIFHGQRTAIFQIDMARFERVFARIGKGLYYTEKGEIWDRSIYVMTPSLREDDLSLSRFNDYKASFEVCFNECEKKGRNQEVFYYQITQIDDMCIIKMVFYGGFCIYVFSLEHLQNSVSHHTDKRDSFSVDER